SSSETGMFFSAPWYRNSESPDPKPIYMNIRPPLLRLCNSLNILMSGIMTAWNGISIEATNKKNTNPLILLLFLDNAYAAIAEKKTIQTMLTVVIRKELKNVLKKSNSSKALMKLSKMGSFGGASVFSNISLFDLNALT